jgi:hypothetical protein
MEWIKTSKRLPDERVKPVLLFNGDAPHYNQYVFQGTWFGQSQNFVTDYKFLGTITHWMPLPEPPTK